MRTVELGKTGIEVTELAHGTLIFGRLQAQLPTEEGAAALRRSYELGVRFVDTAQAYDSYRHVRAFLDEVRPDDVVLASKSHLKTREEMAAAVDEALVELGVERVDIMHLHAVKDAADLANREGPLEALVAAREAGKIRAIGMTSHAVEPFRAALKIPEIEVLHPIYNRQGLGLLDGTNDELLDALRALKNDGRGLYAMKILAGGHYVSDMEAALAWFRETAICHAAAVGMKTPEEVEVDVGLFETGRLADADRERLQDFEKHLIVYDRCGRCGKCVEACQQGAMLVGEEKAENDPATCILCGYCAEVCPKFVIRVI